MSSENARSVSAPAEQAAGQAKNSADLEGSASAKGPKENNPLQSSQQTVAAAPEKTTSERDDLLSRIARMQAEFENARKRLAREQDEFKELALADAIKSLLPVLDSLDWALQSQYQSVEEFRSGISLIRKQLHDSLSKLGLQEIPANGELFDPHLHEAVELVNTTVAQDNHVLKDVRRGYKLKDRLLRPAMVLVAHNPEQGSVREGQSKEGHQSEFEKAA
jgi:molecular chaperone GrpE